MKALVSDGLPRTIKVGPLRYTVGLRRNLQIKAEDMAYMESFRHEGDIVNLRGVHTADDLRVEFDLSSPPTLFRQTVVHELLHALVAFAPVSDMFESDETEEKFVKRLSPWLLGLLQDNPRLVEFLTDRRQGGAGSASWWRRRGQR